MDGPTLYDEDILAWAEQQAAALRGLASKGHAISNELDLEHLAEEIEDVGKSEVHRTRSFLRLLLVHLLKVVSVPHARPVEHWRSEARLFQSELTRSATPSIRRGIDLDETWKLAIELADGELVAEIGRILPGLPEMCPLTWNDLLVKQVEIDALTAKIRASTT